MLRVFKQGQQPPSAPTPDAPPDTPDVDTGASPAEAQTENEDPDQEQNDDSITETQGDKLPKPLVVYMDSDEGPFQCDHCRYYQDPGQCSKVDGAIDPGGCCDLFNPSPDQADTDDAGQEDAGVDTATDNTTGADGEGQ